jgi:fermentation-respiration switch protein FrsA (DUF1100 family)
VLAPAPIGVDALILESVYANIDAALGNRLRARLGPAAGAAFAPVLVASGETDDRTTPDEARAPFARAVGQKRFVLVRGAGHIDLEAHDPGAYCAEVLTFLSLHLRRRGTLSPPTVPG